MDYSSYEMIITKRLIYFLVIGLIVTMLGIVAMIYLFKNMRQEKTVFLMLSFLSIGAIIGSIILTGCVAISSSYDIKNHAYVVWEGEFLVGKDVETRSGTCTLYLPDKDGLKLETDAYLIEAGKYQGTVVYGEKTKIVLDVQLGTQTVLERTGDGSVS